MRVEKFFRINLDSTAAIAIRAVLMTIFLIGVVLAQGHLSNLADKKSLLFITLSGVASACSWLFYFLALKHGKISAVQLLAIILIAAGTLLLATLSFDGKLSAA